MVMECVTEFEKKVSLALCNEQCDVSIPIEMGEELVKVVEKLCRPQKVKMDDSLGYYCPVCNHRIFFQQKHCDECGQMIGWE